MNFEAANPAAQVLACVRFLGLVSGTAVASVFRFDQRGCVAQNRVIAVDPRWEA